MQELEVMKYHEIHMEKKLEIQDRIVALKYTFLECRNLSIYSHYLSSSLKKCIDF